MSDVASSSRPNRLLGGFAVIATLALPLGVLAVPMSETVAVIAPPGRDAAAIVARAGGTILRLGAGSNVLVVRAGSSGLVARLYASGAWLVVDARFATACTPASQT
ncbi:hypothetical protein ACLBWX_15115 [Methylobacterium sp. M6A4_1b]